MAPGEKPVPIHAWVIQKNNKVRAEEHALVLEVWGNSHIAVAQRDKAAYDILGRFELAEEHRSSVSSDLTR